MQEDLLSIRQRVLEATLRYDLIIGTYASHTDNGMNKYVNDAQLYLDINLTHPNQIRRQYKLLSSGENTLQIEGLLYVCGNNKGREGVVLYNDGGSERYDITENVVDKADMYENEDEPITGWQTGTPEFWAYNTIGLAPKHIEDGDDSAAFAAAGFDGYSDVLFTVDYNTTGLIFLPVADADYTVFVRGKFVSRTLSSNTDTSLWTYQFPQLLALTTALEIEGTLRTAQGQETWMKAAARWMDGVHVADTYRELAEFEYKLGGW